MPRFRLDHHHEPADCAAAFAAWKGFSSPLRGTTATSSCRSGGHGIWWEIEADDEVAALAHIPPYLAVRTCVARVDEVAIP